MLNIIADLTKAENGVYVLWGIAFVGLVLKMISNTYIKNLMKKSENMATVKKKKLRVLRQKYENRKSLGMEGSSGDFVEKNVRSYRFMGVPFDALGRHINIGVYAAVIATAGAFLLYEPTWRGSPAMVTFLANSVMVCAFLMSLENIFLTRTKLEIMKANIRDYLDHMTERKAYPRQNAENGKNGCGNYRRDTGGENEVAADFMADKEVMVIPETAVSSGADAQIAATDEVAATQDAGKQAAAGEYSIRDKPPDAEEISLDSFLKEFFC